MSRFDYVCHVVTEFCTEMGLPALVPDADGRLSLNFDDITVTLQHVTWPIEQLTVLIDLGETPAGAPGLAALLELNLAAWGRGTMTIGLTADRQRVLGRSGVPVAGLDTTSLRATLEPMLVTAKSIRAALADLSHSMPAPSGEHDPGRGAPPPGFGAVRV